MIAVGDAAPDFTVKDQDGEEVTLADFTGRKVLIAFYPLDWSPGCQNQMDAFSAGWDQVSGTGAKVFGISVDSHWSHKAWREARDLKIPLLSDWNGDAVRGYGVGHDLRGMQDVAERSAFLVDRDGIIRGSWRYETGDLPDFDELLSAARSLS